MAFEADSRGLEPRPTPIKFPTTDLRELRVEASRRKVTVSELVRGAVREFLQRCSKEPREPADAR